MTCVVWVKRTACAFAVAPDLLPAAARFSDELRRHFADRLFRRGRAILLPDVLADAHLGGLDVGVEQHGAGGGHWRSRRGCGR